MKKLPRLTALILILLLLATLVPLSGYAFLQDGELGLAARWLPWRADLLEPAAWQALDRQQESAARQLFGEALARGALSAQGALQWGELDWQAGAHQQAIRGWESFARGDQASAELFLRLAQAYQSLGQESSREQALTRGAALFPQNAKMRFALALWLMSETPSQARLHLEAARVLDPQIDARYEPLALALNEALATHDLAYQRVVCGRALAAVGEWPLAERAFMRAAQANPNYAEAWAWLGEARQQTGAALAWEALRRALWLAPDDAAVNARAGLYWQRVGDFGRALIFLDRAAALEPDNSAWQMAIGEAEFLTGNLPLAYQGYAFATTLAPSDAQTWRALAVFCAVTESCLRESGLPAALNAIRLAPNDWRSPDALGRVLLALGNTESARRMFARAAELAPRQPEPQFHLGLLWFNEGRLPEARLAFERALALDPQGEVGAQARRVLERYFSP